MGGESYRRNGGWRAATRSLVLPNVPTVAEAGLQGFEVVGWNGLLAPARTPRPIIEKLHTEIVRILHSRDVVASLPADGSMSAGHRLELPHLTPFRRWKS
jgi:tripartite-type tricarboxylate transporter receptor subunit TctC